MKIEQNKVVTFFYSLKNEHGEELENNFESEPTAYLHGYRNIFPALEEALTGLEVTDEKSVQLKPEQAYGPRRTDASQRVPIKHILGKPKKLKVGQFVKVNTEKGAVDGSVIKAGKFMVEVDFNHPLAGAALTFDIKIDGVRDATEEELSHKHDHGRRGHHH